MRTRTLLPAVLDGRSDLERLLTVSDRLFDRYLTSITDSKGATHLDVYEEPQGFHVEWDIPGVAREDVRVSVNGQQLTIQARRPQVVQDERRYHVNERTFGDFQRTLGLPSEVDVAGIEANLKDGVLHLYLPKLASKQPREVPITVG